MGAVEHPVVAEDGVHLSERVLKDRLWVQGLEVVVDSLGENEWAEEGVRVGGDLTFEQDLDSQRYARGRGDGWGIGELRGKGNRRSQGDRGRERDGRGGRNCGCERDSWRGGEIAIGDGLCELAHEKRQDTQSYAKE